MGNALLVSGLVIFRIRPEERMIIRLLERVVFRLIIVVEAVLLINVAYGMRHWETYNVSMAKPCTRLL